MKTIVLRLKGWQFIGLQVMFKAAWMRQSDQTVLAMTEPAIKEGKFKKLAEGAALRPGDIFEVEIPSILWDALKEEFFRTLPVPQGGTDGIYMDLDYDFVKTVGTEIESRLSAPESS